MGCDNHRLVSMHSNVCRLFILLKGCISQYTRLLYWRDASHNTVDYCIGGMHPQYTRLLYWRDASHNTLDYCIGGMQASHTRPVALT